MHMGTKSTNGIIWYPTMSKTYGNVSEEKQSCPLIKAGELRLYCIGGGHEFI